MRNVSAFKTFQPLSHSLTLNLATPNWVMLGLRNWGSGERGWRDEGEHRGDLERNLSSFFEGATQLCLQRNQAGSPNICLFVNYCIIWQIKLLPSSQTSLLCYFKQYQEKGVKRGHLRSAIYFSIPLKSRSKSANTTSACHVCLKCSFVKTVAVSCNLNWTQRKKNRLGNL